MPEDLRETEALREAPTQPAVKTPGATLKEGSILLERFKLIRLIGRGGMGEVYEARDLRLDATVALKTVRGSLAGSADLLQQLRREVKLAQTVTHPHVCRIFDLHEGAGPDGGPLAFLTMEYLDGETLAERIRRIGPVAPADAIPLLEQIAEGLAAIHAEGLVHQDFKPSNVMLVQETGSLNAVVTDFGIARRAAGEGGDAGWPGDGGVIFGSPAYMAPEQRSSGRVTARTDEFSLALVSCEIVTGRLPEGRALVGVPRGWRPAIRRALALDPAARYADPLQFVAELSGRRRRRIRTRVALLLALGLAALLLVVERPWTAPPSPAADRRSIAVLPLANLGASADDAYFSEGLAEDILTQLSKVRGLRVISRTSTSVYRGTPKPLREVAAELGVGTVLEGSVRRAAGRVRITVQLVDARTDQHLWAETYDRDAREVLDVQSDVASKVAAALALQLTQADNARLRRGSTTNPDAYDYYLRGVSKSDQWWRLQNLREAKADLEKALELDPGYALARGRLAYCLAQLAAYHDVTDRSLFERARKEAARALELEPSLGLPHLAEGVLHFSHLGEWNLDAAVREVERAQELEPTALGHSLLGSYHLHRGLEEAGLRELELGLELDPLSDAGRVLITTGYEMAGRWQDAVARTRALNPEPKATRRAWKALVRVGQVDAVERVYDPAVAPNGQQSDDRIARAMVLALRGKGAEAGALVKEIVDAGGPKQASTYHHDTYELAVVEAQLGHPDRAVAWLRRTVDNGMPDYLLFTRDPLLDPIRADPGFVHLMAGLKPRWERWRAAAR